MSKANAPDIPLAMIVDDETVDQMIYKRVIDQSGRIEKTLTFSLAEQALDYLRETDRAQVDIVFLDINMPRMSGIEFLEVATQEFGEDFSRLVVIMLTASIHPDDHAQLESHPAVGPFLGKPLTHENLHEVAEAYAARMAKSAAQPGEASGQG